MNSGVLMRCYVASGAVLVAALLPGCGGSAKSHTTSSGQAASSGLPQSDVVYPEKLKRDFDAICKAMGHSGPICSRILTITEIAEPAKSFLAYVRVAAVKAKTDGRFSGTQAEQAAASVKYATREIVEATVNATVKDGAANEQSSTLPTTDQTGP